ncbi:MAG: hypothetical protein ACXW3L_10555 [Limisphaerales bacterium]
MPIAARALSDTIGHPVELLAKPFKPTELKEIPERASSNVLSDVPTRGLNPEKNLVAA